MLERVSREPATPCLSEAARFALFETAAGGAGDVGELSLRRGERLASAYPVRM